MNVQGTSSLLNALFGWAWQTSLAALVLIALVWIIQQVLRKWLPVRWLHALWVCVLVRLLLPAVPPASFSIFNLGLPLSVEGERRLPAVTPELSQVSPDLNRPQHLSTQLRGTPDIPTVSVNRLLQLASYLWAFGTLFYLAIIWSHHRRFCRWLRRQQPTTDPRLIALIAEARRQLKIRSEIPVFEASGTPSLFGAFKPHLLLPKSALENLTEVELRHIILHELIHFKRRDVLLNWLVIVAQSLHWFNPFVWLAMRQLRAVREMTCDAAVLTQLSENEHKAYGATLIKIIASCSEISPTPSLVPILNRKKQMHRRISMIAKYKPTTRLIAIASALLVIALAALTFTRAAEKQRAPAEALAPAAVTEPAKPTASAERNVRILEEMLHEQQHRIRAQQAELDEAKKKLGITQLEESANPPGADALRQLQALRLEAQADYDKVSALFERLAALTRVELMRSISTASPDAGLAALFDQQAAAEQKLAALTQNFSAEHPEVKQISKLLATIKKQIDERVEGVLLGLKTKVASMKSRMEQLEVELEKTKRLDIDRAIRNRPYFESKQDLERLQKARERILERLTEEQINAAIGK